MISKKAEIAPKTVRDNWKALVTTDEFERGLAILARRSKHHIYLLKGMIFAQLSDDPAPVKLTGSTSNTHRSGGGTAYYYVQQSR